MRSTVLLTLLLVASMTCVLATSPPICTGVVCANEQCNPVNCQCGSYKGSCGCCDVCYKCPGEECIILHQHQCTSGHTCQLNDPEGNIHQGAPGTCKAEAEGEHAHHGHHEKSD